MWNFNSYAIDPNIIGESRKITDEGELLKFKLGAAINKVITNMTVEEVLLKTELDRGDLSRIKTQNILRFSTDRLIKILILLGQSVNITVKNKKKVASWYVQNSPSN